MPRPTLSLPLKTLLCLLDVAIVNLFRLHGWKLIVRERFSSLCSVAHQSTQSTKFSVPEIDVNDASKCCRMQQIHSLPPRLHLQLRPPLPPLYSLRPLFLQPRLLCMRLPHRLLQSTPIPFPCPQVHSTSDHRLSLMASNSGKCRQHLSTLPWSLGPTPGAFQADTRFLLESGTTMDSRLRGLQRPVSQPSHPMHLPRSMYVRTSGLLICLHFQM